MIDFRHVLITIAAVFLALAVGIGVGAGLTSGLGPGLLPGPGLGSGPESGSEAAAGGHAGSRADADRLGKQNAELRARLDRLERVVAYRDAFAAEVGDGLVRGRLSGRTVVLVALPGSDHGMLHEIRDVLEAAGATVTGTVRVGDGWADPGQRQLLEDLAVRLAADGVRLPDRGSAYDRAGAVLARALVTPQDGSEAATAATTGTAADATTDTILGGFGESGLLTVETEELVRADLAVVVAPNPEDLVEEPQDLKDAAVRREAARAWVALAHALDVAGQGCVLAGDFASGPEGGVSAALRSDRRTSRLVSSVEAADLPGGQVALVWALAEQLAGGAGDYGSAGATDGVLPKPAGGS